jgi:hypothetical protein
LQPSDWQNRTSLDFYLEWSPGHRMTLVLSNRLNLLEQEDLAFLSRETVRNDLREAYLSCEVAAGLFLEAGRVNVRNGAALGFNPTDFFKTRTLVGQASLDPSIMRQNRLGTLMVRGQKIWSRGAISLALAPKLFRPSAIVDDSRFGVDPRFDATNAEHRLLGTLSLDVGSWSPQLLGYFERGRSKVGFNLSRPFGDAVVAYAEWVGGTEKSLAARSMEYAQATEAFPASVPMLALAADDTGSAFRNDVVGGASWTIASKVTLNVEYHYHQAGFTRRSWQNWFDLGSTVGVPAVTVDELWYVRAYANDQQEPMSRHQIFVRASWPRALVSDLELGGFAVVDMYDGSTLAQVMATYYLSYRWTFAAYGSINAGAPRSERGSLPQFAGAVLELIAYL